MMAWKSREVIQYLGASNDYSPSLSLSTISCSIAFWCLQVYY
uniref:Uncharacterized protein n=1 Tax=Arundo donax TaxID=35708 RepID=A0A0A9E7F4_ARUDO